MAIRKVTDCQGPSTVAIRKVMTVRCLYCGIRKVTDSQWPV